MTTTVVPGATLVITEGSALDDVGGGVVAGGVEEGVVELVVPELELESLPNDATLFVVPLR